MISATMKIQERQLYKIKAKLLAEFIYNLDRNERIPSRKKGKQERSIAMPYLAEKKSHHLSRSSTET